MITTEIALALLIAVFTALGLAFAIGARITASAAPRQSITLSALGTVFAAMSVGAMLVFAVVSATTG